MTPKALVLRCAGTNCNVETGWALEKAGADVEQVHLNQLLRGDKKLGHYGILAIPGGFSFGDDVASGKVLANKLLHGLRDSLGEFVASGRPVIGICNGFQVLVKCGLLPGFGGWDDKLSVTLTDNDSGLFEARWIFLKVHNKKSFYVKGLPEVFPLPVAHGEGKFMTESDKVFKSMERNGQVLFRYVDPRGRKGDYPWNPNGSQGDVAGITNAAGNVLGLMPHPERYAFPRQHSHWTQLKPLPEQGVGLQIFKNAVRYASS